MLSDTLTAIVLRALELARFVASAAGVPPAPRAPSDPAWRMWPFSGPGGMKMGPLVAKYLFVGGIFLALIFLLRFLFGPGGLMRDAWIDEDMERRRQKREAALREADRPENDDQGRSGGGVA